MSCSEGEAFTSWFAIEEEEQIQGGLRRREGRQVLTGLQGGADEARRPGRMGKGKGSQQNG